MSGKSDQLAALSELAQMVMDAEIMRLGVALSKRRAIDNARNCLRAARREVRGNAAPDGAHLSGRAELWFGWADDKMKGLSTVLALAAAEEETVRKSATRAAGRADALARLAGRQAGKSRR